MEDRGLDHEVEDRRHLVPSGAYTQGPGTVIYAKGFLDHPASSCVPVPGLMRMPRGRLPC